MKKETPKEREKRKKRAEEQMKNLGYVSLRNRKSPQAIELAMEASGGNLRVLCGLLKCTIREIMVLLQIDNELRKKWEDIRKSMVSEAESVMTTLLGSKSEDMRFRVAKYILDRRGKDLGYAPQGTQVTVETNKEGDTSINAIFGISE